MSWSSTVITTNITTTAVNNRHSTSVTIPCFTLFQTKHKKTQGRVMSRQLHRNASELSSKPSQCLSRNHPAFFFASLSTPASIHTLLLQHAKPPKSSLAKPLSGVSSSRTIIPTIPITTPTPYPPNCWRCLYKKKRSTASKGIRGQRSND